MVAPSRMTSRLTLWWVIRSKALKGGDVVVFSRLTKADGTEKKLDWKMRPCGTRYCIYDLLGNNASFSAARRISPKTDTQE